MKPATPTNPVPPATGAIPPVPPGADVRKVSTVAEAVRALEEGPEKGYVLFGAKVLREALKVFMRRNRVERRGPEDEIVPLFTPEHLNALFGDLSFAQQAFLLRLLRDPGAFVSREELHRAIRGGSGKTSRPSHSLNQIAFVLRKKLGKDGIGRCIETVPGTGFRWNREKEPKSLSEAFLKVVGLAALTVLAVAVAIHGFAFRGADAAPPSAEPCRAMRTFSDDGPAGEPSASVPSAKGRSPRRAADGMEDTWFESAGPARTGDWLSFPLPDPSGAAGPDRGRIGIRFGRPGGGPPFAPPCRVEWTAGPSAGAPPAWLPLGDVDPAAGLFSADLPSSPVAAVRVLVVADSPLPLAVREVSVSVPDAD